MFVGYSTGLPASFPLYIHFLSTGLVYYKEKVFTFFFFQSINPFVYSFPLKRHTIFFFFTTPSTTPRTPPITTPPLKTALWGLFVFLYLLNFQKGGGPVFITAFPLVFIILL